MTICAIVLPGEGRVAQLLRQNHTWLKPMTVLAESSPYPRICVTLGNLLP